MWLERRKPPEERWGWALMYCQVEIIFYRVYTERQHPSPQPL